MLAQLLHELDDDLLQCFKNYTYEPTMEAEVLFFESDAGYRVGIVQSPLVATFFSVATIDMNDTEKRNKIVDTISPRHLSEAIRQRLANGPLAKLDLDNGSHLEVFPGIGGKSHPGIGNYHDIEF